MARLAWRAAPFAGVGAGMALALAVDMTAPPCQQETDGKLIRAGVSKMSDFLFLRF